MTNQKSNQSTSSGWFCPALAIQTNNTGNERNAMMERKKQSEVAR
jgi:hypothetical protein